MGSILIAMPKINDSDHLSELIRSNGLLYDIEICKTAAEVLRIANERDYGIVICTKTIFEMGYVELSGYLPEYFGMIILTKDITLETFSENIVKLLLPLKTRELISTIGMTSSRFERRVRKKKKAPPRRSEAEQRIVEDAKALLIERNGLTEPQAFRYIQKCSMDTGRSMVESAQMILMLND